MAAVGLPPIGTGGMVLGKPTLPVFPLILIPPLAAVALGPLLLVALRHWSVCRKAVDDRQQFLHLHSVNPSQAGGRASSCSLSISVTGLPPAMAAQAAVLPSGPLHPEYDLAGAPLR